MPALLPSNLKIALVHDWLLGIGGAEKTLKTVHEIFPQAPIYTLFYDKKFTDKLLPKAEIRPSSLQKIYNLVGSHKLLTPFLPLAIESFDFSEFDLVISSSVAFSKGLILKPQTRHICYCYSPTRQLWDWHTEYKNESRFIPTWITALVQHLLRIWDRQAATRVDHFVAISENVRRRIKKYYGQDSIVIYPPAIQAVDIQNESAVKKEHFLIVSRLYKHKNVDITIKAFNKLGWPLVIIGDGPEFKKLKKIASSNVKLLGYESDETIKKYYADCLAFIMPQEEDFGITPIEAMSYGKPVLALARGGALEYIYPGINGEFFEDATEEVLADGVRRLVQNMPKYNAETIKKTAEQFSKEKFKNEINKFLVTTLE
ncbi:MAG: glycosyltransferase [Patescibacteria group bacterium]